MPPVPRRSTISYLPSRTDPVSRTFKRTPPGMSGYCSGAAVGAESRSRTDAETDRGAARYAPVESLRDQETGLAPPRTGAHQFFITRAVAVLAPIILARGPGGGLVGPFLVGLPGEGHLALRRDRGLVGHEGRAAAGGARRGRAGRAARAPRRGRVLVGHDVAAAAARPDLGQLGAEEQDLRRVVGPEQDDHQRAGRAVDRGHAAVAQVEADQELADGEQQGGYRGAEHQRAPPDLPAGAER